MLKRIWKTLFRRNDNIAPQAYPCSMQDLRGGDLCWCGSGKQYRKCHRSEDRRREKELGIKRRKGTIYEAFT